METQFNRLPNGTNVVKQDGYKNRGGWSKYAIFSKSGYMILLSARESSKREARRAALKEINVNISDIKKIYGSLSERPLKRYISNLR